MKDWKCNTAIPSSPKPRKSLNQLTLNPEVWNHPLTHEGLEVQCHETNPTRPSFLVAAGRFWSRILRFRNKAQSLQSPLIKEYTLNLIRVPILI